jgi:hypothetical protein
MPHQHRLSSHIKVPEASLQTSTRPCTARRYAAVFGVSDARSQALATFNAIDAALHDRTNGGWVLMQAGWPMAFAGSSMRLGTIGGGASVLAVYACRSDCYLAW